MLVGDKFLVVTIVRLRIAYSRNLLNLVVFHADAQNMILTRISSVVGPSLFQIREASGNGVIVGSQQNVQANHSLPTNKTEQGLIGNEMRRGYQERRSKKTDQLTDSAHGLSCGTKVKSFEKFMQFNWLAMLIESGLLS